MREIIARAVCALSAGVVLLLSMWFALVHNPPETDTQAVSRPAATAESDAVARGRVVYAEQNCGSCHSIAGRGNPRHPLDDVGLPGSDAKLADLITGTGIPGLGEAVARRKAKYRDLPAQDLQALEAYLLSLAER
jgi:mono/diheme cytochrome c family protein